MDWGYSYLDLRYNFGFGSASPTDLPNSDHIRLENYTELSHLQGSKSAQLHTQDIILVILFFSKLG